MRDYHLRPVSNPEWVTNGWVPVPASEIEQALVEAINAQTAAVNGMADAIDNILCNFLSNSHDASTPYSSTGNSAPFGGVQGGEVQQSVNQSVSDSDKNKLAGDLGQVPGDDVTDPPASVTSVNVVNWGSMAVPSVVGEPDPEVPEKKSLRVKLDWFYSSLQGLPMVSWLTGYHLTIGTGSPVVNFTLPRLTGGSFQVVLNLENDTILGLGLGAWLALAGNIMYSIFSAYWLIWLFRG